MMHKIIDAAKKLAETGSFEDITLNQIDLQSIYSQLFLLLQKHHWTKELKTISVNHDNYASYYVERVLQTSTTPDDPESKQLVKTILLRVKHLQEFDAYDVEDYKMYPMIAKFCKHTNNYWKDDYQLPYPNDIDPIKLREEVFDLIQRPKFKSILQGIDSLVKASGKGSFFDGNKASLNVTMCTYLLAMFKSQFLLHDRRIPDRFEEITNIYYDYIQTLNLPNDYFEYQTI